MVLEFDSLVQTKSHKALELQKIAKEEKERQAEKERKIRIKGFCQRMSLVYNPSLALTFVAVYWVIGLRNAQFF